jgi:hypothetical protein
MIGYIFGSETLTHLLTHSTAMVPNSTLVESERIVHLLRLHYHCLVVSLMIQFVVHLLRSTGTNDLKLPTHHIRDIASFPLHFRHLHGQPASTLQSIRVYSSSG